MLTTADLVWKSWEASFVGTRILSSSLNLNTLLMFMIFPTVQEERCVLSRSLYLDHIVASYSYCCILSGGILIVASYPEQSRSLDLIHIVASYPDQCISFGLLHLIQINLNCYILSRKDTDCCILFRTIGIIASYPDNCILSGLLHLLRIMCYWHHLGGPICN